MSLFVHSQPFCLFWQRQMAHRECQVFTKYLPMLGHTKGFGKHHILLVRSSSYVVPQVFSSYAPPRVRLVIGARSCSPPHVFILFICLDTKVMI